MRHFGKAYLAFWVITALLAMEVLHPMHTAAGKSAPFLGFVTIGADGNLWFPERHGIGRMTAAGRVKHFPLGAEPAYPITAGPDGAIWFALRRELGALTPDGHLRTYPLPPHVEEVGGLAISSDHHLWFTLNYVSGPSRIGWLDASGEIVTYQIPGGGGARNLTAGPDGNLWFISATPDAIGRITLAGVITMYNLPERGPGNGYYDPIDIVTGADGALWFTGSGGVGRMTTAGRFSWHHIDSDSGSSWRIAAGSDGNLWATEIYGDHIWRVTPGGKVRAFRVPTHNSGPLGIVAGPDGNLWVTVTCANRLLRITPAGKMREFPVSDAHWDGSYCFDPV